MAKATTFKVNVIVRIEPERRLLMERHWRSLILTLGLMAVPACEANEDHHSPPDALPDAPVVVDFDAACKAPDGPAITLDSLHVAEHLAGRWWRCGGAAEFYGNVEFTLDLHFYMLSMVNGQFVRNVGPRTSGTYSVDQSPLGISFSIRQLYQDGTGATYPLLGNIMESPRKLQLGGGHYVAIH